MITMNTRDEIDTARLLSKLNLKLLILSFYNFVYMFLNFQKLQCHIICFVFRQQFYQAYQTCALHAFSPAFVILWCCYAFWRDPWHFFAQILNFRFLLFWHRNMQNELVIWRPIRIYFLKTRRAWRLKSSWSTRRCFMNFIKPLSWTPQIYGLKFRV